MMTDSKSGPARLWQIVEEMPTQPLEVLGGISAAARGSWLLLFADHVHQAPVSHFIEAFLPVYMWGVLLIMLGVGQLAGLAIERDQPRRSLDLRWLCSLLLVAATCLILVGYFWYDRDSIAIPLYSTMLVKQLWIFMRSRAPAFRNGTQIVRRSGDLTDAHGTI